MEKYFFIGIKGSGMSSLAHILKDLGHEVSGSDIPEYVFTETGLIEKGISIVPFDPANIDGESIYVIGNAFNEQNNEEVKKVKENKFEKFYYHDFLGKMSREKISVGISGVHGKTSTTSLMAHLFEKTVGANYLVGDGNGKGDEKSKYFIFEACEYKNHFLHYNPCYGIITNIDFDHPDFFKSEREVVASFTEYVKNVRKKVLIYGDDDKYKQIIVREHAKLLTYGFNESNVFQALNLKQTKEGIAYDFYVKGNFVQTIELPVFGKHNILNSLAVLGVMYLERMDLSLINEAAKDYEGAKRRFQIETKGEYTWINDYAHHPAEISATIEATKQRFPDKKVVAIFQPHTFTRTATFLNEFKKSLSKADAVYGCEIFGSAREDKGTTSIEILLDGISNARTLTHSSTEDLLLHKSDIMLFMGAGDIEKYIVELKKNIN